MLNSGNVYKTTRSNTGYVVDGSHRNIFNKVINKMEKVSSILECETKNGSYFISGSDIYVHTFDNRAPDKDVVCVFNWSVGYKMFRLFNSTLFMENFEIFNYDGTNIRGDETSHFIFNNCDFGETLSNNSLSLQLAGKIYLFNCSAHDSFMDGFNYHYTPGKDNRNCLVFEYDCFGFNNGNQETGTGNNFTTAHEGVSVIRVNSFGEESQGVICADVNGSYSVLIDCKMERSKLPKSNLRSSSYQFTTDSATVPAKVKLINCSGVSENWSILTDEQKGTELTLESWFEGLDKVNRTVSL